MDDRAAMTHEEWQAEGKRIFGDDMSKWRFVCPVCAHEASVKDWEDAGAPRGAFAFSCVGRYLGAESFAGKGEGPCNYAGGGLFQLNPVEVVDEFGLSMKVFAFADAPIAEQVESVTGLERS